MLSAARWPAGAVNGRMRSLSSTSARDSIASPQPAGEASGGVGGRFDPARAATTAWWSCESVKGLIT